MNSKINQKRNIKFLVLFCGDKSLEHLLMCTLNHSFVDDFMITTVLFFFFAHTHGMFFPGSPAGKESTCNAENPGLTPGPGTSSGEGIG